MLTVGVLRGTSQISLSITNTDLTRLLPRMLPKIVAISMTIVTILYVLAVTSYHIVLDMDTMMSGSALASVSCTNPALFLIFPAYFPIQTYD